MTTLPLSTIKERLYYDSATQQPAAFLDSIVIYYAHLKIEVECNSKAIVDELSHYFRHFITTQTPTTISLKISAVNTQSVELDLPFTEWQREGGKIGPAKDTFFDFPELHTRIIRKARTTMVFLQSDSELIAAGPCEQNSNQVINFVNHQILNAHLHNNSLLCHAAALSIQGKGIGIAGFSGGGKSTTMLHLLDIPSSQFISNDRAFVLYGNGTTDITGIPKMPRINPGTIVHNPKLQNMLSNERRDELLALPQHELWELEEKYDVDIEAVWGENSLTDQVPLDSFFILNWQHNSSEPTTVNLVKPAERRDLLPAVMKSFGCFYQYADGHFDTAPNMSAEQDYIDAFNSINFYEVAGAVDFEAIKIWFQQKFNT